MDLNASYDQTEEKDVIEISRPGILRAIKQFEDQLEGVDNTPCEPVKEHPQFHSRAGKIHMPIRCPSQTGD